MNREHGGELLAFRGINAAGESTVLGLQERQAAAHLLSIGRRSGDPMKISCWLDELDMIIRSVPSFAIWQIDTLDSCFRRYCNVLQLASRDVRFRRACVELMANAERISDKLDLARRSRQWPPFNRAAFELRQDCEQLSGIINRVDLESDIVAGDAPLSRTI